MSNIGSEASSLQVVVNPDMKPPMMHLALKQGKKASKESNALTFKGSIVETQSDSQNDNDNCQEDGDNHTRQRKKFTIEGIEKMQE